MKAMFVRVVKRKLRDDVALDFKLLESYRPEPGHTPKQRFLKQWTIRKDDIWAMSDMFLDDVEFDLDYLAPVNEQKKILGVVKKILRREGR
jgi:hypothetical protein